MSTSSPVTERTTSGPVTKTRPAGPMITRSVSAGPYAAPPAAGPRTTEICGIRPEDRTMAAKTSPTACSAVTPSASRAPPECQMPTTGTRSRSAASIASTMCWQPSNPIAPPMTVASVQYAIAGDPATVPRAARTPEVSRGASGCIDPASKNLASRSSGSRGSVAGSVGLACRVVTGPPRASGQAGARAGRAAVVTPS
jgi:hypothetical protein